MNLLLQIFLLGLGLLSQAQSQEVYRFEVEVRTVYVDAFVTRDGKAVRGLTDEDFEVLDNGVRQEIEIMDPQTMPLSAMLVLDTSQSVSGEKLDHLRGAAHAFVEEMQEQDEAGLITFAHLWHLRMRLGDDFGTLHETLDQPMETGLTGLNDALYAGLKLVGEGQGRPMVLLFTDGLDNASWLAEKELLDVVRAAQAVVHVVGIKSSDETVSKDTVAATPAGRPRRASQFLREAASATGGQVWYADASRNLREVFLRVLEEMETRYLLTYQIREPVEEGWHTLEVRLKNGKADAIRARKGYMLGDTRGRLK